MTFKTHPLQATLDRLTLVDGGIVTDIGTPDADHILASDLISEDMTALRAALERQTRHHPTMEPRTQASYLIGDYVWYISAAAVGAYLTERRAPDLSADNIALRYSTYTWHEGDASGEAERVDVRYLRGTFACLPDDPAADHPDAVVLMDEAALLAWMRDRLETHLRPLIARVLEMTKLGESAQWRLVADACAARFLYAGQLVEAEPCAMTDGLVFVRSVDSPMNNPQTGYITLTAAGHTDSFRARGGCCRYYTTSASGDDYCTTCVLRTPEDRDARLRAYMQRKYGESAS